GFVRHEVAGRSGKIQPDQHSHRTADEEEDGDGGQIQERDPLVIAREQPRFDPVAVVQIVPERSKSSSHGYRGCTWGRAWSDFTYSMSSSSCSSVTSP